MTIYELILPVIMMIESGGDCNAVGKHGEIGPYQILPIVLEDLKRAKGRSYTTEDCKDPKIAGKIVVDYMRLCWSRGGFWNAHPCPRDIEKLVRMYNGGPRGHKRRATIPYWLRFKEAYVRFYGTELRSVIDFTGAAEAQKKSAWWNDPEFVLQKRVPSRR